MPVNDKKIFNIYGDNNMISNENKYRFEYICDAVTDSEKVSDGIGTLSEKTLHSVLKKYYEFNSDFHEIKVGKYVADIYNNTNTKKGYTTDIVEIQTANFNKLRGKLDYFLKNHSVTVVYTIPHIKNLSWVDTDTGQISKARRSPKTGNEFMAAKELYKIKMYLLNPNLHIHIALIDLDEYRLLNGYSADKKKGSTRNERLPVGLFDIITIDKINDYKKLIPDNLADTFTSADYAKCAKVTLSMAQCALNILTHTESVIRTGKKGNAIIYRRNL